MAGKTPPQLSVATDVEATDLLVSWRGSGPLKGLPFETALEAIASDLTYESTLPGAASRPLQDKLSDQVAIKDFLDDSGNPIDGNFSVIDDAIDSAIDAEVKLWLNPGDYVITREHIYNPIAMVDIPPLPNLSSVGAFAQGFQFVGAGMTATRIHVRVPGGFAFRCNVTNPIPYAYRAEMGMQFGNFAMVGRGLTDTDCGGIEIFNSYQGSVQFINARNMSGAFIKLVNGLEGDVPDSGWNSMGFQNLWVEGCAVGGNAFAIDATGVEGRNEGSFTLNRHVFMQSCGRNQFFTVTGFSTANPAIVSVNLQQMPAVSPTVTAHPFVLGDRTIGFGIKKTQTLALDPITTVAGTPVVTIASSAHGLAINDNVRISGAAAVGGITLDGDYQITSTATNSFTVVHSASATSAATGGGAAVVLVSPMKASQTAYYVGPTTTATTFQLYQASGAALALGTDPIATTSGSATVTVTRTAHGLAPGDYVVINFAVPFNGVVIEKGYSVVATPTANTFTITASSLATATGSGGGTVAKVQKIVTFDGASIGTWTGDLATPTALANNPFNTLNGSADVVVTHTAHGAVAGDLVTFAGASAGNGITLNGQYRVIGVGDRTLPTPADQLNKYRVTALTTANASGDVGGASVTALYQYRSVRLGEVGYYEPKSGAFQYKGQLLRLDQCGFTLNHNGAATYVKGGSGGAIGIFATQTTWENNYRGHVLAKGGINYIFDGNQLHGNNDAGLFQWYGFRLDATENVIQQVKFRNNKVRAKNCPMVAFDYFGAQGQINTLEIDGTLWSDFDYPGQVRIRGFPFRQIAQNLILTYSSPTAMILRPDQFAGGGNKTPLRLSGPNNDSGTGARSYSGEWVQWQLSSNNGLTLSNSGLANSTLYYVYIYDNDGVAALVASVVPPAIDVTHGYQTLPGDPTMLFVGEAQTDGAAAFTTTGHGFLQLRRVGGPQSGAQAYEWDDWGLGRTLNRNGARPTSASQSVGFRPWLQVGTKSHNFGNLAAGATETTTLTTGVVCALGDTVMKPYLSIDQQTITLDAWVSAANTITVLAKNEGGVAVDLANATLSASYYRNS